MTSAGGVRAGQAYVELGVKNKMKGSLAKVVKQLKKFAVGAAKVIGVATAAVAAFGVASVKAFAAFGDSIHKMSARTGVGAAALTELKFAAEQSGASINDVEKAIKRMSVTLLDAGRGSKESADALASIGLSAAKLKGLSPELQFEAMMRGLRGVASATERAALAQKLFGRAGTTLLPMINDMKALRVQAQKLGLVMSQEGVQAAADITDAINTVKNAWKGMFFSVLDDNAKFLSAMAKMTEVFAVTLENIFKMMVVNVGTQMMKLYKPLLKMMGVPGLDLAMGGAEAMAGAVTSSEMEKIIKEMMGEFMSGGDGPGDATAGTPGKGRAPGTTVPTYWEAMQSQNAAFASMIPEGQATGGIARSSSAVGSFVGGYGVGQNGSRVIEVNQQQLQEQKKTNSLLEESQRMAAMQNGNLPIFGQGN